MFSVRDILVRVVADGRDSNRLTVGQVMTAPVVCVTPDTELVECKSIMTTRRIRHIPVVVEGELIGIVTSGDIMARESREREVTIESLVEYIGGPPPPFHPCVVGPRDCAPSTRPSPPERPHVCENRKR